MRITNSKFTSVTMFGQESNRYAYMTSSNSHETVSVLPGGFCSLLWVLLTIYICMYLCEAVAQVSIFGGFFLFQHPPSITFQDNKLASEHLLRFYRWLENATLGFRAVDSIVDELPMQTLSSRYIHMVSASGKLEITVCALYVGNVTLVDHAIVTVTHYSNSCLFLVCHAGV